MQVSIEHTGPLERKMKIDVPEDRIASEVQNRLKSMSRTTRMDGFRPGKVPLKVLEKRYGLQLRQEVVGEVVRSTFIETIQSEELRPAGEPVIEPITQEQAEGMSFHATFEVYPEVSLSDPSALQLERPVCMISEQDIDKMVETLRKQQQTWKQVERAAQQGDQLTLDFIGSIDGEVFDGGEANDFQIELGSSRFIEGFEEGLVGAMPGAELELDLKFPEDYHASHLAGKPVHFAVKVKTVEEAELPELTDEVLQRFGIEEGGVEAFRKEIRDNMEREQAHASRNRFKENVMDALVKANALDVPKALLANEAYRLAADMRQNLMTRGASAEQSRAIQPSLFKDQARRRVTLGLLMADIIKQQGIKAEPARVRETIEGMAASYDDPDAVVKWYYDDQERLGDIEAAVMEDLVVDWLASQAQVSESTMAFDELMKPRAEAETEKA